MIDGSSKVKKLYDCLRLPHASNLPFLFIPQALFIQSRAKFSSPPRQEQKYLKPRHTVLRASIFKMHSLLSRFALSALFLRSLATPIPDDSSQPAHPPWDQVSIKGITYAGSGCPPGSIELVPSPASNTSHISIAFDSLFPYPDPGSNPNEARRNCHLTFGLQFPAGWSLTVFEMSTFGDIYLDKKFSATQQATFRWASQSTTATLNSTWVGPICGNISFTDKLAPDAYVWSSCKGDSHSLTINTSIQIENSKNPKPSCTVPEVINKKLTQTYDCQWRRC
ncbi:hypothetical protein BGX38DRAFT_1167592 [Terfezia claveryi]|nr:hypothetical protein BGX38DRAFT_1167592 [Terfezia claveryi]